MLQVLLVDDEPFIIQGLRVLIDWKKEGFEIAGSAANGQEALDFIQNNHVDLIFADIKMPVMDGLTLLDRIRKEKLTEAYFVILSGYADFSYAQEAIRNLCTDYILKPVDREGLVEVLHKVTKMNNIVEQEKQDNREKERAYLARHLLALISGKFDKINLDYVKNHIHLSGGVRYIEIAFDEQQCSEELSDEEKRLYQRKLYQACLDFLKEDGNHCVFDASGQEKIYDIGFVYCDYMAENKNMTEQEYLQNFHNYLQEIVQMPIIVLVGKKVNTAAAIAKSYGTACVLRSFQGFRIKKEIYYYEKEVQVANEGVVLCKKSLDALLSAIEQNSQVEIRKSVELFYEEMHTMGVTGEIMTLNINYMLFQLIHLATEQDGDINQEEILRIISESTFEEGIMRGSKAHLSRFACEYGDYLAQLRKNSAKGVLGSIEKEIKEHYAENLTLKEFSEKYYVNSAYLGQLFRKQYNQSFKDYLNNYRIEQAAARLVRTDEKIYQIAEAVGYHDLDYFVNRFILTKGCTPVKFRRQARSQSSDKE